MMALGGSTNGVLHLLALAREANVPLAVDDFNTIAKDVPLLGNLKPSGRCGNHTTALLSAPRGCYACTACATGSLSRGPHQRDVASTNRAGM